MIDNVLESPGVGVDTKGTAVELDPRQQRFISLYFDTGSKNFGNCYKSALAAGYSQATARNLTHLRPAWLSEIIGQHRGLEPEHLLLKLEQIVTSRSESTPNKLKAINMLMRHHQMYGDDRAQSLQINIQNVLD